MRKFRSFSTDIHGDKSDSSKRKSSANGFSPSSTKRPKIEEENYYLHHEDEDFDPIQHYRSSNGPEVSAVLRRVRFPKSAVFVYSSEQHPVFAQHVDQMRSKISSFVIYRIALGNPRKVEEQIRVPEDKFRRLIIDLLCQLKWRSTVTRPQHIPPMMWRYLLEVLPLEDILLLFPQMERQTLHLLDILFIYNSFGDDDDDETLDGEEHPGIDYVTEAELYHLTQEYYLLKLKEAEQQQQQEESSRNFARYEFFLPGKIVRLYSRIPYGFFS